MADKTYRLILKDSENQAVSVDLENLKNLAIATKKLFESYEKLLTETDENQKLLEENDQKVKAAEAKEQRRKRRELKGNLTDGNISTTIETDEEQEA